VRENQNFDAARGAGSSANEAISFECDDHLMDRWRTDLEMALDVGFGRRAPKHVRIGVDEGQVLTLLFGEALVDGVVRSA